MTLIFNGHTFKYELESLTMMFLPGVKFTIVYETNMADIKDDFICAELTENNGSTNLEVTVNIGGDILKKSQTIATNTENYKQECERILAVLIYEILSKKLNIYPKWGIQTGIRPVKTVNRLRDNGLNDDEIIRYLKDYYLTTEEKTKLCIKTANTQAELLKQIDPNGVSLYISIPFCPSRCSYCSFVSHSIEKATKLVPEYVELLQREIEHTGKLAAELGLKLETVYFGGGTPTSLCAEDIRTLTNCVSQHFDLSNLKEYTFEAGRPDTITESKLLAIKEAGVTRISINPQTLNDPVLEAIGRKHTTKQTIDSFHLARKIGFDNINMDIIVGLPLDTYESYLHTLNGILELNPENITVHTLSIKRSSTLRENAEATYDAKALEIDKMLSITHEMLYNNLYNPYYLYRQKNTLGNFENVGFAKKGYEGIYNIHIMEESNTILAVGAGAVTKLKNHQSGLINRIFNFKYPYEYIKHFSDILSRKGQVKEFYEEQF